METAEIILRYLQVILGWPVVCLVLGLLFLLLFKQSISDLFRRIFEGEAYGVRFKASNSSEQNIETTKKPQLTTQDEFEKYIKENTKEVKEELFRYFNGYWFERTFNRIYGTQIDLLEHLVNNGNQGDKYINLMGFYNEFIKRSRFTTQLPDYIRFLIEMRLIEVIGEGSESTVKITPHGINFISYIRTQYASTYKYKAF